MALAGLVAISALVRFWAALRLDVPWISPDETVYALLGRSLWGEDGSLVGTAQQTCGLFTLPPGR